MTPKKPRKNTHCMNCAKEIPSERRASAKYCSNKCKNAFNGVKSYHRDPEKMRAAARKSWHNRAPASRLYRNARWRATNKNLEFNITVEDIVVPEVCPVLGVPLVLQEGQAAPNSPSLDRIDSTKGYVKGNIQVISHRANRIKTDATTDEIYALWKHMEGIQNENSTIRSGIRRTDPTDDQGTQSGFEGFRHTAGMVMP